jgi:hypothetical protein
LHRVKLVECNAPNIDLFHLEHLARVTYLNLGGSGLSDEGLSSLGRLRGVLSLELSETRVSDAALGHLRGFPDLFWLGLANTGITDAGLRPIALLTNLHTLDLRGTRVTDVGVLALQTALPQLEIVR